MTMAIAYIGAGSNLGQREAWISKAAALLDSRPATVHVKQMSPLYETPPALSGEVAPEESDPDRIGWFLNGVLELETTLAPRELLEHLLHVESQLGRVRPAHPPQAQEPPAFLSRTIDLDLLFYDDLVLQSRDLIVPHPRAHERSFVMFPMRDLKQDFLHPVLLETMQTISEKPLVPERITRWEGRRSESSCDR